MCLAFPGKVIKIDGKKATVKYPLETREVLVGEDGIEIGDMVLVQMGIIIQKITQDQGDTAQKAWEEV